jgi:GNAT superfamily N-acetyltransferase
VTAAVVPVDVADILDLRRRVLRDGTPSPDPRFPEDADPATFHLAIRDDGRVVATITLCPKPTPYRPGATAAQLRGMAVDPVVQGAGYGAALFDAAVGRLRAEGVACLWANARDSALGFYTRMGMTVVGDGFVVADSGLPHHVVLLDL